MELVKLYTQIILKSVISFIFGRKAFNVPSLIDLTQKHCIDLVVFGFVSYTNRTTKLPRICGGVPDTPFVQH